LNLVKATINRLHPWMSLYTLLT